MSNEAQALWYVVHTYSGYENKVAENIKRMVESRNLGDLIFETRIPTEIVVDTQEEADDYLDPAEDDGEEVSEDDYFDDEDDDDESGEAKKRRRKTKEKKPTEHKMFPSYVLVKMIMNDESWHVVRNIRGVTGFVGPGSKPVPLTDDEVSALGVDVRVRKPEYTVGDSVIVVAGFLAGSIATVKEIDEAAGRIKVAALINGKETNVDMSASEVEPLKD